MPHEIDRESKPQPRPVSGNVGATPAPARAGSLRNEVRKLGYEEGSARLRPGSVGPGRREGAAPPKGSATVVAAAGAREWSFDDSFAPALLEALRKNPGRPVADVLFEMASRELPVANEEQPAHHPEGIQVGSVGAGSGPFPGGRRRATLVANENYVENSKLDAPARSRPATPSHRRLPDPRAAAPVARPTRKCRPGPPHRGRTPEVEMIPLKQP